MPCKKCGQRTTRNRLCAQCARHERYGSFSHSESQSSPERIRYECANCGTEYVSDGLGECPGCGRTRARALEVVEDDIDRGRGVVPDGGREESTSERSAETVVAVDLFCGAGGLSTALAEACEDLERDVELVAVNHWGKAIETHRRNHPWATHLNAKVEELHPPDVVEPGSVDILIAAPECTHFSTARGGKPTKEQKRASPMHVLDWVGKVRPRTLLLENVPEFKSWGPVVDGEPSRDGTKFDAWKAQLEADRYSVRHGTLNAADYGDATSRRRFFVMARRDYRPSFPEPTHGDAEDLPDRRPAADIIDWSDTGESIWTRSRPLLNNTMQRIAEGIRQHCDGRLEPYADVVADITPDDIEAMQEDVVAVENVAEAASSPACSPPSPSATTRQQRRFEVARDAAQPLPGAFLVVSVKRRVYRAAVRRSIPRGHG